MFALYYSMSTPRSVGKIKEAAVNLKFEIVAFSQCPRLRGAHNQER